MSSHIYRHELCHTLHYDGRETERVNDEKEKEIGEWEHREKVGNRTAKKERSRGEREWIHREGQI